jgi:hypothetical protein
MMGAAIMAGSFAIGVNYGIEGLARVWLIGFPVLIAVTMLASMPVIGIGIGAFGRALFPGLAASLAMAGIVEGVELMLPPMPLLGHLALLVLLGIASYALLLIVFARPLVIELRDLLIRRKPLIAEA